MTRAEELGITEQGLEGTERILKTEHMYETKINNPNYTGILTTKEMRLLISNPSKQRMSEEGSVNKLAVISLLHKNYWRPTCA